MPQPTNRLDLGTRRGITAQTVIQHLAERTAESMGANGRGGDSLAERIGNAALAGLLRRFEEDGLLPSASANGGTATMKDVVEAFRAVHEAARDTEDRQHQRMKELQAENEALRAQLQSQAGGNMGVMVEFFKVMAEMQQRSEERFYRLLETFETRTRELIQEIRTHVAGQDGSRIERLLEEFRRATDPVELATKYRALREAFGLDQPPSNNHASSSPPSSLPLELLPEYWRIDLERYRADLQHKREMAELERAEKRADALQALLKEVAQARRQESGPALPLGAGVLASGPKHPPRVRYTCDACGAEFIGERASTVRCPHCSSELEVVGDAGSSHPPAHPGPAPQDPAGGPAVGGEPESV